MMCLLTTAFRAGVLLRAIEIVAEMSNSPTRQINKGKEKVRWHIHKYYRRPKS